MIAQGATNEEVSIFRQPDTGDFEAARSQGSGRRAVPWTQRQYSADLSVAREVWRYGRIDNDRDRGSEMAIKLVGLHDLTASDLILSRELWLPIDVIVGVYFCVTAYKAEI